jgi:hypothetical protein
MKAKHEGIAADRLFYAFVDFGKDLVSQPACFIVPSRRVAKVLGEAHSLWLATPGQRGQQRKDGEMRRFLPDYDRMGLSIGCGAGWLDAYHEAWHLIEDCPSELPV